MKYYIYNTEKYYDEDEVCYEDTHKVKKAMQVLELAKCLKTTTVTK